MLRSSLPVGRFMNVDLRVHLTFPLLLLLAAVYSAFTTGSAARGIALWLALCFAVLVREVARSIAAAYAGLRLRALFLLPVGGVMAFSLRDGAPNQPASAAATRWVTLSGPIANFTVGLLILGMSYGLDPAVSLFSQPWIGIGHILRSLIWLQLVLGLVSLLPTPVMPSRELLRTRSSQKLPGGSGPSFGLGTALALAMILAGFLMMQHYWLIILGAFMLLGAQLAGPQSLHTAEADSILVEEVMLTEYTLLSSSDTLQGALERTVHSLQDVFPVVRGDQLVGSIARQSIAERLVAEGDSYLQGAMLRNLQVATPREKLVDALRRAATLGAGEFIPVVEDDADLRMVGILTPQSLHRAVQQVKLTRAARPQREQP